jgi:hypothetical protein
MAARMSELHDAVPDALTPPAHFARPLRPESPLFGEANQLAGATIPAGQVFRVGEQSPLQFQMRFVFWDWGPLPSSGFWDSAAELLPVS